MLRKTGWGAVLLAAGMLSAPFAAMAQSIPGGQNLDLAPSDPIIPLPLGHDRIGSTGGLYAAAEFVMYRQTNPIKRQQVATRGFVDVDGAVTGDRNGTVVNTDTDVPFIIRGPVVPGNRFGSGVEALNTGDLKQQETFQPGYQFTLGYKFDSGSAIELKYLNVVRAHYNALASLAPPDFAVGPSLDDTFLFSPVFNFPASFAGPAFKTALGNPNSLFGIFNGASEMSIDFTQGFTQADLTGKVPWFQSDACRIYGTAGGRFAWIWERFRWRTTSLDFSGNGGPDDVAVYTNIVSNRMYGPVAGIGIDRYLGGGFAIAMEGQVAGLVDIVKERAQFERGDKAVQVKKGINTAAFVPEVNANVNLMWYPWEAVQVRVGYNFMAFFNTQASDQPIAFDFRNLDPDYSSRGVRYLDGFNAGVAFIF